MASIKYIPLSVPYILGHEWRYVKRCLDTGWVSTAGSFVDELERKIAALTQSRYAVACVSGTVALQVALEVVGVELDDEVIVPTTTFIAPVNAVRYVRANPVFMDCDRYYNIDVDKTLDFLENNTRQKDRQCINKKSGRVIKAIIPIHVFGNAVDLYRLLRVCRKKNIKVVEDATESLGTAYKTGKPAGALGDMGCLSFNGNKIITAGGGGMIVTDNKRYASLAKYLTTQAKDDAIYYIHNRIGYNYRLNNMQAALGVAQLEKLGRFIEMKERNYRTYKRLIDDIEGLHLADVPDYARNNYWMYALQIDEKRYGRNRDELIKLFAKENIQVRPLWHLNHLQKPYEGYETYKIENAYAMLQKTLNIPCSPGLSKGQILKVSGLLKKWKK